MIVFYWKQQLVCFVVLVSLYVLFVLFEPPEQGVRISLYNSPSRECAQRRLSLPDDIYIAASGFTSSNTNRYQPSKSEAASVLYPYRLRLQACDNPKPPSFATAFHLDEEFTPGTYASYAIASGHTSVQRLHGQRVAVVVRGSLTENTELYEALEVLAKSVAGNELYDMFYVYDKTQDGATSENLQTLRETHPDVFGYQSGVTVRGVDPWFIIGQCLHQLSRQPGFANGFGYSLGWAFGPELVAPLFFGCSPGCMKMDTMDHDERYDLFWLLEVDVVNTGADPVADFFTSCDQQNVDHQTGAHLDLPVDLITPYPLRLVDRVHLSTFTNYLTDDMTVSFHNLIVIQRVSRRLLHKYWQNAMECGLGGYCEVGLPNLCGLWKDCTASYMRPEYNGHMGWKPARDHDTMFEDALLALEGDQVSVVHESGLDLSNYNRWVHKSHGYTSEHKHRLLSALNNRTKTRFFQSIT